MNPLVTIKLPYPTTVYARTVESFDCHWLEVLKPISFRPVDSVLKPDILKTWYVQGEYWQLLNFHQWGMRLIHGIPNGSAEWFGHRARYVDWPMMRPYGLGFCFAVYSKMSAMVPGESTPNVNSPGVVPEEVVEYCKAMFKGKEGTHYVLLG